MIKFCSIFNFYKFFDSCAHIKLFVAKKNLFKNWPRKTILLEWRLNTNQHWKRIFTSNAASPINSNFVVYQPKNNILFLFRASSHFFILFHYLPYLLFRAQWGEPVRGSVREWKTPPRRHPTTDHRAGPEGSQTMRHIQGSTGKTTLTSQHTPKLSPYRNKQNRPGKDGQKKLSQVREKRIPAELSPELQNSIYFI